MNKAVIARPTGPRTSRGKTRSSTNRVQHGLRGQGLLVPGESEEQYQENLQGWLDSSRAGSYAEARIVAELADLGWKLLRLRRIEYTAVLRNVEAQLAMNPRSRSLTALTQASAAIDALLGGLRIGLARDPLPSNTQGLEALILGTKGVLKILDGIDAIWADQELMTQQLLGMEAAACADLAGRHHILMLQETARSIQGRLKTNIAEAQAEIEAIREKLLGELPLPGDGDSKKLARYRAQIENSMSRTLDILSKTKSVSKKPGKRSGAKGGSFGSGRSGPSVTLRVVK